MKKNTYIISAILGMFLVSSILAMSGVLNPSAGVVDDKGLINYNSDVCVYIDRVDGSHEDLGCSHNLLTTAGKNAIRDQLVGTDGPPHAVSFSWIGLCNSSFGGSCTTPAVGDTALGNEFPTGATGLNRTNEATLLRLGTGNWSYSRTFVAGADGMTTNETGIFNASAAGTLLAVNSFTSSTLQTNDQITINWSIWVA